jgi:hypothetical protein
MLLKELLTGQEKLPVIVKRKITVEPEVKHLQDMEVETHITHFN